MEQDPELRRAAADMAMHHPYVESQLPQTPELTGDLLTDASSQFDLGVDELTRFADDNGFDTVSLAQKFLIIADNIGGGLSPEGKRMWLFSRFSDGFTLDEVLLDSMTLQD
jgi:hypothetical protein